MTKTFTVRGHKMRTNTIRRFVVVAVRPETIVITEDSDAHRFFGREVGTYPAFSEIIRRSDSPWTAMKVARSESFRHGVGTAVVVVDTETGEEAS